MKTFATTPAFENEKRWHDLRFVLPSNYRKGIQHEMRSYLFCKQLQVPSMLRYYCAYYLAKNGSLDLVFPSIPIENGSLDFVFPSMQAKKMTWFYNQPLKQYCSFLQFWLKKIFCADYPAQQLPYPIKLEQLFPILIAHTIFFSRVVDESSSSELD